MFLWLKNGKVISLSGKALDIIRLPDEDSDDVTMTFALVIVHNTADPPPQAASQRDATDDAYWKKFEIIAECESLDAGEIRLGEPLEPLLDKICEAIRRGDPLLDLRSEQTSLSLDDVQERSDEAERKQSEREARKFDAAQREKDFKVKL